MELVGRGGFHEESAPVHDGEQLVPSSYEVVVVRSVQGSRIMIGKVRRNKRPDGEELYELGYRDQVNHDDEVLCASPHARSSALAHDPFGGDSMVLGLPSIQNQLLHI